MRQNIGDGESAEGGYTDGGAHVVYEDAESGGAYAEQAVVGNAVADGGHGVFADAEPEVAPFRGFRREVSCAGKVVFIGAVKVRAGGQEAGIRFSDGVDGNGSGRTGSIAIVLREGRYCLVRVCRIDAAGAGVDACVQFLCQFRISPAPLFVHGVPGIEIFFPLGFQVCESGTDVFGDVITFSGRNFPVGVRFFLKPGSAFPMAFCGAFNAGNALADDRFGNDELGFPVFGVFGGFNR